MHCTIKLVEGLAASQRRSVVFLVVDEREASAAAVFDSMRSADGKRSNQQRTLLARFDFWIANGAQDNWFHGWPNDATYANCFTFKWKHRNVDQRFYGFVCNPMPKTNPRFQLCVLHSHAPKSQQHTESRYLDLAVRLSKTIEVWAAIRQQFPDEEQKEKL